MAYDLHMNESASLLHLAISNCADPSNWTKSQDNIVRACDGGISIDQQTTRATPVNPSSGYFMEPHQILALVLSSVAITLNVLSLLAIAQIRNRMSTHLRLIISLCMSDLIIAISMCLHVLNNELNPYTGVGSTGQKLWSMCSYMVVKALNSTGLTICLLNLAMMAVDHFMAISQPLHYNLRMRSGKIALIISLMWFLAFVGGFSDFFTGWNTYYINQGYNYCEAVYLSLYNDEYIVFCMFFLTLVLIVTIYSRIYQKIRMHRTPGEESNTCKPGFKRTTSERRRNKQALITTLLILGTFMLCWTPICIYQLGLIIQVNISVKRLQNVAHLLLIIDRYLYDLMLLNSIADPIIYAIRMYDVQLGYRRLFHICRPLPKQGTEITLLPWAKQGNAQSISGSRRLKTEGSMKYSSKQNTGKPEEIAGNKTKLILTDDASPV